MEKKPKTEKQETVNSSNVIRDASLVVLAMFAFGFLFPERWWGTHGLAFLPPVVSIAVAALAVYFIFFFRLKPQTAESFESKKLDKKNATIWAIALASGFALCAYLLPEQFHLYGDSPNFVNDLSNVVSEGQLDHWGLFFDPNILNAKVGERTVLNGVVVLSELLNTTPIRAFQIFDAVVGGVYVFISIRFVQVYFSSRSWQLVAGILLCASPFVFNFFGHIEIYAPSFLMISAFLMTVLMYFRSPTAKRLLLLVILYLISAKFHFANLLLLFPALLTTTIHYFTRNKKSFWERLSWKRVGITILFPLFLLFMYVYVGILGDHADPRWLEKDLPVFERLFLPVVSPEAPLDNYNLLSVNHLLDYLNEMVLWSVSGLLLLLIFFTKLRKKISWNRSEVFVLGITLLCYAGFFFMLNPLLGMPVDWDLLALPAPALILFTLVLANDDRLKEWGRKFIGPVIGVTLLGSTFLLVNWDSEALSHRFESVGKHTYKTYWITGAADIVLALNMEGDKGKYEERLLKVLDELEPHASDGNDREYARLLKTMGEFYLIRGNKPEQGLDYFEQAYAYDKNDMEIVRGLVEGYFRTNNMQGAFSGAQILLRNAFPNHKIALSMCVHMALELDNYEAALAYVKGYQEAYPGNEDMQYIFENLTRGTNLTELKHVFRN